MKPIFSSIVLLVAYMSCMAQLSYTEEQNLRDNFSHPGVNGSEIINKAGIKVEAAYEMLTNKENEIVDSFLVSYSEYDSLGNITGSVVYNNMDEIIKEYTNTYQNGKLIKQYHSVIVNDILQGSFLVQFNDKNQEEYLYFYLPGSTEAIVHKKVYDGKNKLQSLWQADPFTNKFSIVASYDYLSDGNLKRIKKYPPAFNFQKNNKHIIRIKNNEVSKTLFFKRKNSSKSFESVYDEDGNELVTFSYDENGKCVSKKMFLSGDSVNEIAPGIDHAATNSSPVVYGRANNTMAFITSPVATNPQLNGILATGAPQVLSFINNSGVNSPSYNSSNTPALAAVTNARMNADNNWNPVSDPFPPSYNSVYPKAAKTVAVSTANFYFNPDETVQRISVINVAGMPVKTILYYYNNAVVLK